MARIRAEHVRRAAKEMGERRWTWAELYEALGPLMQAHSDKAVVQGHVRDARKRGEIERTGTGEFVYRGCGAPRRTRIDVVWHLVRSHRHFTTDEIELLSGAARATVLEYLQCLARLGLIRRDRVGSWTLVRDPGPDTPVNTAKCKRLAAMRRRKAGTR